MASVSYVESLLSSVEAKLKRPLVQVFSYLLSNLRFGRPTADRAENFQLYSVTGTTHSIANTEFTIRHGMSTTPYLAIPILNLGDPTAKVVRLSVSRAADATFLYLKSPDVSSVFRLYLEG